MELNIISDRNGTLQPLNLLRSRDYHTNEQGIIYGVSHKSGAVAIKAHDGKLTICVKSLSRCGPPNVFFLPQ